MTIPALTALSHPRSLYTLSLTPTLGRLGSWLFSQKINSRMKDLVDRIAQSYLCAAIAIGSSLVLASTGGLGSIVAIISLGNEAYRIVTLFRARILARSYNQLAAFLKSEPPPTTASITKTLPPLIQAIKNGDSQTKKLAANSLFAAFMQSHAPLYCTAAAELGNPSAKGFCLLCGFDQPADFATAKTFISQHIQKRQERATLYKDAACYCVQRSNKEKEKRLQEPGQADPSIDDYNLIKMFIESVNEGLDILSLKKFFSKNDVWSLIYYAGLQQLKMTPPQLDATRLMAHVYREDKKHGLSTGDQRSLIEHQMLVLLTEGLLCVAGLKKPNPLLPYEADLMMADRFLTEMHIQTPKQPHFNPTIQLSLCRNYPSLSVFTDEGQKNYLQKLQEWVNDRIREDRLWVPADLIIDLFPWGLMSNGICLGICIDFVEQMSPFDIDAPTFEENLIAVAKKFEPGGSIASVVYQMAQIIFGPEIKLLASSVLPIIQELASSQYNQVVLVLDQHLPKDVRDKAWKKAVQRARQSSHLHPLQQDAHITTLVNKIFQNLTKPSTFFNLKSKITALRSDIDDAHRLRLLEEIWIPGQSQGIFNAPQVDTPERKQMEKHIVKNCATIRYKCIRASLFKKLNLNLATTSVAQGADIHAKLAAIQQDPVNGFYDIQAPRHAMVLIKKGAQLYLFDPNEGLLKLDREHPETTMNQVLQKYTSPEAKELFEAFKLTKVHSK